MGDQPYWDCYMLVVEVSKSILIKLKKQCFKIKPGVYIYIGSSRKPGLALSRIARHLRRKKKKHWHIDYLTTSTNTIIKGVFLSRTKYKDCEYELTKLLLDMDLEYVPRFGSSDKKQEQSHLFRCSNDLDECLSNIYGYLEALDSIVDIVYAE